MKRLLGGLTALLAVAAVACPQATLGAERSFTVSNCGPACAYSWTVPPRVTSATFDLYGGQGAGSIYHPQAAGGLGGRATATIDVVPGQRYLINVGVKGRLTDPLEFTTEGGRGSVVQLGSSRLIGAGGGGGGSAVDGGAGGLETSTEHEGSEGGGVGSLDGPGAGGSSWGPPGTKFEAGVRSGDGLVTVSYDAFPQDTVLESGPKRLTSDNTPTFSFASNEADVSFQCFDELTFGRCSGPRHTHTTGVLSDGPHTVAVTSTDADGFTDPTPATRTFTVDTRPPAIRITDRPRRNVHTDNRRVTVGVGFKSTEPGVTFECRLDGAKFRRCASPYSARTRAGHRGVKHRVAVRGADPAGNAATSVVRFVAIRSR